MKAVYSLGVAGAVVLSLMLPQVSQAAVPKTITGLVTKITGSQIIFNNGNGASYAADIGSAILTRKNGAPLQFGEILVGDKVQVIGTLWGDNSISASSLSDLTLYAHTGTFSGKVTSINPTSGSFTMQGTTYGVQSITTNNFTAYSFNGSTATFKNIGLGMTVSVKGIWDRSRANVLASQVKITERLINIYFTGTISMESSSSLTVIGNGNVIYGVDVSKAALQTKTGTTTALSLFKLGDSLRVWGKHLSGSVQIVGTTVKDSSR